MTRILSYMNRALWVCKYYVILLTPVYTHVSSRQIRYTLGVVSNFYSDLDHFYFYFNISGWFRGNFSHFFSKNGHCSSFFFLRPVLDSSRLRDSGALCFRCQLSKWRTKKRYSTAIRKNAVPGPYDTGTVRMEARYSPFRTALPFWEELRGKHLGLD